jgi:alpha-tubulin suppressor-like RCC1 family protein
MYGIGDNEFGQLGDGTTLKTHTLKEIPTSHQFTQISAGAFHVLAIEDGNCYGWGRFDRGQIAQKPKKE